jgi:hypothetical protein
MSSGACPDATNVRGEAFPQQWSLKQLDPREASLDRSRVSPK